MIPSKTLYRPYFLGWWHWVRFPRYLTSRNAISKKNAPKTGWVDVLHWNLTAKMTSHVWSPRNLLYIYIYTCSFLSATIIFGVSICWISRGITLRIFVGRKKSLGCPGARIFPPIPHTSSSVATRKSSWTIRSGPGLGVGLKGWSWVEGGWGGKLGWGGVGWGGWVEFGGWG